MSDDLIRRAREALVDVAPGPWEAALEKGCHGIVASIQEEARFVAVIGNAPETPEREPMRFANARFIAAARDLVPAMADRLEAQEALLREAMAVLERCPPTSNPTLTAEYNLERIEAWWRLEVRPVLAKP